jgi:2,4-dienoyl-CoA reductase-like NADH-dependent reductase (Old Yellow Enzyme family)
LKLQADTIEVSSGIAEEGFVFSRGTIPFDMLRKYNDRMKQIPKILFPFVKPVLKKMLASPKPLLLYNIDAAAEIKKNVNIPVIAVGGIRKLEDIKRIIENGQCDYISMSRPFIIEPDIVKKFKEGKQTESKCINCNYCIAAAEAETLKCHYGKI